MCVSLSLSLSLRPPYSVASAVECLYCVPWSFRHLLPRVAARLMRFREINSSPPSSRIPEYCLSHTLDFSVVLAGLLAENFALYKCSWNSLRTCSRMHMQLGRSGRLQVNAKTCFPLDVVECIILILTYDLSHRSNFFFNYSCIFSCKEHRLTEEDKRVKILRTLNP